MYLERPERRQTYWLLPGCPTRFVVCLANRGDSNVSNQRDRVRPFRDLVDVIAEGFVYVIILVGVGVTAFWTWVIMHALLVLVVPDWAAFVLCVLAYIGLGYLALRGIVIVSARLSLKVLRLMLPRMQ